MIHNSIQIFSGGFSTNAVSFEHVREKLTAALSRFPVHKVLMGWSTEGKAGLASKELYLKTGEFLAKHNIELYLWFPVFSETTTIRLLHALIDLDGVPVHHKNTSSNENFSFCCPNNPDNIEMILDIFDKEFSSIPFKGIFLDKIRYPSFAQDTVFSCFCPYCQRKYKDNNFDVELLKKSLSISRQTPLGITAYHGSGRYDFEDPVIKRFFSLKSSFIFESLNYITGYFKSKNLDIGLDVFAPFLSPFVGQDLPALSGLCSFIKPMMYRITNAPAGLPFETESLLRETGYAENAKRLAFEKVLGINSKEIPFSLGFASTELKNFAASSGCPVYAGIEINKKEIAETDPGYIEETIKSFLDTGIKGLALSWDLLDVPVENLDAVGRLFR